MRKVLWVVGIAYVAFVFHLAIAEVTKLTDSRFGAIVMILCVLDSVSIGYTVWKIMKKNEAARRASGSPATSSQD